MSLGLSRELLMAEVVLARGLAPAGDVATALQRYWAASRTGSVTRSIVRLRPGRSRRRELRSRAIARASSSRGVASGSTESNQ